MKKTLLILGIIGAGLLNATGQEIHSPAEIMKIMEKSPVSYELSMLEKEILPPDRSNNLNYNHFYRVEDKGQMSTYEYKVDTIIHKDLIDAEKYFREQKFAEAREKYLSVLKKDETYFQVMTYIGQTYGLEGDIDKAIEWYKKTIDINYIDYMAHWFLSDAYKTKGKLKEAVDEISIAMILNRNNPRIEKSLKNTFEAQKLKTEDWTFTPQMKIDSVGAEKVKIEFHPDWLGYAMVKALWKYEPGYRASMGAKKGTVSTTEEREGFASLVASFNKKKLKKYPEFKALKLAIDKDMINEYIFYEIILPEHPFVAYQLPAEFIDEIKNYITAIRGKQK